MHRNRILLIRLWEDYAVYDHRANRQIKEFCDAKGVKMLDFLSYKDHIMKILTSLYSEAVWQEFLQYKREKQHISKRGQSRKGLSGEKDAKGFIKAMNHKFFDAGDGTDFSWSRWFFPNLTTDRGLKEIDGCMQQYIRYCVTGRHYKGNYRISYQQMKEWGYRNLVHEFYEWHSIVNN